MRPTNDGRRVAIVAGCRTPFCKAGTVLKDISAVDLAKHAVVELVHRAELDGDVVDEMYFGQVVPSLLPQFPKSIPAASVNRACASANAAIAQGHDQITLGHADVVVAGGAESLSNIPILHSRRFSELLTRLSKARTIPERAKLMSTFRPKDLIPLTPAAVRPIGRASFSEKRITFPWCAPMKISLSPSVISTP